MKEFRDKPKLFTAIWLAAFIFVGCSFDSASTMAIPLRPIEDLIAYEDMIRLQAPMAVRDSMYSQAGYDASGEMIFLEFDREVFPTDVMVYFTEEMDEPLVFLARAPHSRCILTWNIDGDGLLRDPCFGSVYTAEGKYISGPSPRDLDVIPSYVQDGVLWVEPRIIYGETHP